MLAIGQEASRLLLKAKREFLSGSIVPAADTPGADEISITEIDSTLLQRRNPILITSAQLVEQVPNGVHLKRAQDHDPALADDRRGIEMTDREIVQHPHPLSAIARRMLGLIIDGHEGGQSRIVRRGLGRLPQQRYGPLSNQNLDERRDGRWFDHSEA
jgi:hypothetical protein